MKNNLILSLSWKALLLLPAFCLALPLFNASAEPYAKQKASQTGQSIEKRTKELKESTSMLKKEWQAQKEAYKKKFADILKDLQAYTDELERSLDYGDPVLRRKIRIDLDDLQRISDDFKKIHAELIAATAVKWLNIKGNLDKAKQNVQDNLS